LTFSFYSNKIWQCAGPCPGRLIKNQGGYVPQREGNMSHKLLLADDSITIQKVVELILAEEGFEIKAVNNGREALSAIPQFRPDVVLADIEMPVMNGYQLCEKIKTNQDTKDIPVILLAGAFEPLDEGLAKNVMADDFIVKPFESVELINKVNGVLISKEIGEELPAAEEAVEVSEVIGSAEDIWTLEDIEAEPASEKEAFAETPVEEGVTFEDAFGKEGLAELAAEDIVLGETLAEEVSAPIAPASHGMPQVEMPSKEEFAGLFRDTLNERVSSFLVDLDVKEDLINVLAPPLKDMAEKVLREIAPVIVEKVVREVLQNSLAPLSQEVEKVIWETVPDLAEGLISEEIKKIRSEL
jgi:CheY-like chemotaxis protein